jgi:LysW-gamma-L-lysine carboxypeptidase
MLRAHLRALAGDADVQFAGDEPAYRAPKNTALVRAFLASLRAHGASPAFRLKTGTSDMNIVGPVWNCPILAYGPGDSGLDHTPHEHVSLVEFGRAIAVLQDALARLSI